MMKKTSLFAVLMVITVIGVGQASFAACSATTLTTGSATWGLESYGVGPSGHLVNTLIQATFVSGGTFTGTEWQSVAGTFTGPTSISGTWTQSSPVTDCQGTITVTSPSTQTFNFAINAAGKGGTLAETDANYTTAGIMVAQGTVTCSASTLKNKQLSLYSYGTIPAVGGTVSATGEIKFSKTGTTFTSSPTVSLDLNAAGNYTVPANGTATVASDCTGSGSLTAPALSQTFNVNLVVVDSGNEALWIVNNAGDNVTGYFLE